VKLSAEDLQALDSAAPKGVTAGARYPGAMMEILNR
jgi:hypothetical protein